MPAGFGGRITKGSSFPNNLKRKDRSSNRKSGRK